MSEDASRRSLAALADCVGVDSLNTRTRFIRMDLERGGTMQNVRTSLQIACPKCIIRESIVCDDNPTHSLGLDNLILVPSRAFRF
ncbi:hypothetical protein CEXT_580781 [Caerostris extrusa]|uniref:Uncharacterized protein n=1 Tax=Caerostris extrusa TaxID=172846 RepID=A0AAV4V1I3_CAEEX|nr:hypothetical protein CEXT_580781 [Caerostris extrusa]